VQEIPVVSEESSEMPSEMPENAAEIAEEKQKEPPKPAAGLRPEGAPAPKKRGRPKRDPSVPPPPRKPRPKKVKEPPPPSEELHIGAPRVHSRLPSLPPQASPAALRDAPEGRGEGLRQAPPVSAYDAMVHNWKTRQQLQQEAKREMYSRFIERMFA
jgi:hypothetical protein